MMTINSKTISISGISQINEKTAAGFSAAINSDDPVNMSISSWVNDKELYREHIEECRNDEREFRNVVYEIQDKMLKENLA